MRAPNDEKAIFLAALEQATAPEREAYLRRACGDDLELLKRVKVLLSVHEESQGPLDAPAPGVGIAPSIDPPLTERPGTVIGPYKLLEQIGEGGFGVVFMALQQEPLRRKVALKVLKAGMDTRQVIARFEAERQALALMDHPHIAKVLEAGQTASGRPYFVMDLVKGLSITEFCDQAQLTPHERLELFVDVCQAVQHAHQKGIIHRDLKPSNVLVTTQDGAPLVKVIDFGIAKALGEQLTDRTLVTGFAQMLGTPLYMAPEQAALSNVEVDTRSDVYSLGVLLYELLTGTTPFDRERLREVDYDEMRRIIREEEPPRPSTRVSTLGQAASTVSTQRKSDPKRLSRLLHGELDWIVMKALEKDRNRRYESVSALAADIQRYLHHEPVLACPPSVGYRLRKFTRRNRVTLITTGLILLFIVLVGGGISWILRDRAARQTKAANDLGLALDRAELLHGQGKQAEALAALAGAEVLAVQVPADLARSQRLVAVKERVARDQEFLVHFEDIRLRAQSQFSAETSTFDPKAAFPEFRDALNRYGIIVGVMEPSQVAAFLQDRSATIRQNVVAALDECVRWAPRDDAALGKWLLAALAAADKDSWRMEARKAIAGQDWDALARLARDVDVAKQPPNILLMVAGSLPPPMRAPRLELCRRVQRANPADLWANIWLGNELMLHNGQPAEAIRYYTAALALRPGIAALYLYRGESFRLAGETDAAIRDFRHGLALNPQLARLHIGLASALQNKGRLDEALDECRETIRLNKDLFDAHNTLAIVLANKALLNTFRAQGLAGQSLLATDLAHKGLLDEAIAELRTAIQLKPDYAKPYASLGSFLMLKGQLADAVAQSSRAVDLDKNFWLAWSSRGSAYAKLGQYDKARADFETAVKLPPANPWTCNDLAWFLANCPETKLRDPARAAELASKAVQLAPQDANSWNCLGVAQYRTGQYQAAITALDRCLTLSQGGDGAQLFFLAMAHGKLGHRDEARKRHHDGVAWMEQFKEPLEKDRSIAADMRRFQSEADAVLTAMTKEP